MTSKQLRVRVTGALVIIAALHAPMAQAELYVAWKNKIRVHHESNGELLSRMTNSYHGETLTSITVGPDGHVYAAHNFMGAGSVIRFDGRTGNVIDEYVPYDGSVNWGHETLLEKPGDLEFGPDGHLYISSHKVGTGWHIFRYDGGSGQFKGRFPSVGSRFAFAADSYLYIAEDQSTLVGGKIVRYSAQTGQNIGNFAILPQVGGIHDMSFGPDGTLYLLATNMENPRARDIYRVNGATGEFVDLLIDTGAAGMGRSQAPMKMVVGPDGDVYIADAGALLNIWRFDGKTGAFKGIFIHEPLPDYGPAWIAGLAFSIARIAVHNDSAGAYLTWPHTFGNFKLESRATLDAQWEPILEKPLVNGGQLRLDLDPKAEQRFFRLMKR